MIKQINNIIKLVQSIYVCKFVIQTSYDIVKVLGGELKVETKTSSAGSKGKGKGSEFII